MPYPEAYTLSYLSTKKEHSDKDAPSPQLCTLFDIYIHYAL